MTVVEEARRLGIENGLTREQVEILVGDTVALLPLSVARNLFGPLLLLNFYNWFKKDGILDVAMHEFTDVQWEEFTAYFSAPPEVRHVLVACKVQNGEANYPIGIMWADGFKYGGGLKRANVSLCFLKDYWETLLPLESTRRGIRYCFEFLRCDVLYGVTPSENRRSCLFAKRVGMEQVGTIPLWTMYQGHACDASIFCVKKPERS